MHDTSFFVQAFSRNSTQPTITCSKLTIETLEKVVKYVQKYVHFKHISHLVLVFLLLTLSR